MPAKAEDIVRAHAGERFRVGAEINGLRGGGVLWVCPGLIVFESDALTRRLSRVSCVVHGDPDVVLVTARLVPPWFNVSIALQDADSSVRAVTWLLGRARLRDALVRSGFNVREAATLFSRDVAGTGDRDAPHSMATQPWWFVRSIRVAAAAVSALVAVGMVLVVSQSPIFIAALAAVVAANVAATFWR
jgi:hypothetical protein